MGGGMMKRIVAVMLISGLFCVLVADPVYASRPLSTEDAVVAGKGDLESEIGFEYARQNNRDDNYAVTFMPIYGVTEYLQCSIGLPVDIKYSEGGYEAAGLGDITISLKTLLAPEKDIMPALALKIDFKLSNGDKDEGLGSGEEDLGLIVSASKVIGPFTLDGCIGYTFVGMRAEEKCDSAILYGIALKYALTPKLNIVSEVYGEGDLIFDTGAFDEHALNPLIGFTYEINESVVLDTAFKVGVSRNEKVEYGAIAGASMSF
jgi:outer membrane putative beta-barrel porin/alpha-amylase